MPRLSDKTALITGAAILRAFAGGGAFVKCAGTAGLGATAVYVPAVPLPPADQRPASPRWPAAPQHDATRHPKPLKPVPPRL
jgi:hypothetical protein